MFLGLSWQGLVVSQLGVHFETTLCLAQAQVVWVIYLGMGCSDGGQEQHEQHRV